MERERMVCLTLAALCAVYGIYQMILLLRHRSHTADVQAVVMSVSSALPERVKRNNSKWAPGACAGAHGLCGGKPRHRALPAG